jgi:arabinose-5-phosphate isomerase
VSTSTTDRTIADILLPPESIPMMPGRTLVKEALEQMSASKLGLACIVDGNGRLIGLFTDGDLRRLLLRSQKPLSALFADDIIDHARREFTSVRADTSIDDALNLLQEREIFDLPVLDEAGRLQGLIHLHPALRALLGE